MSQQSFVTTDTRDFGEGSFALQGAIQVEIIKIGVRKNRQIRYRVPGEREPVIRWVSTDELRPLPDAPAAPQPPVVAAPPEVKSFDPALVAVVNDAQGFGVGAQEDALAIAHHLLAQGQWDGKQRLLIDDPVHLSAQLLRGKATAYAWHYLQQDGFLLVKKEIDPHHEVYGLRQQNAELTAQRDKLLTDPVRLQVKELEVKLAAAEAARETTEKRALQHEAEMLSKVEAAQVEAEKWRDELKTLELGQPVTPPPAPTVLKTEIKTLVHGLHRRTEVDLEFAQHLNEGWEVLHINTTMCDSPALGEPYTERQITLKRLVQLPAFPPQPTARAVVDLATEFVAALDDDPVVDPADLDTEIEEEFDPVVPISQFAITPEERDALDKLHTHAKQIIILPQERPQRPETQIPIGAALLQDGVDKTMGQMDEANRRIFWATYANALQRTRSYPFQLTAEVE